MHVKKVEKAIVTQTANSATDRLQLHATDSTDTTADMQPTCSLLTKNMYNIILHILKRNNKNTNKHNLKQKSKK